MNDARATIRRGQAELELERAGERWATDPRFLRTNGGVWLRYHTHDSRGSTAGFPDDVYLSAERGLLLAVEWKAEAGYREYLAQRQPRVIAQKGWIDGLNALGCPAVLALVGHPGNAEDIRRMLTGL